MIAEDLLNIKSQEEERMRLESLLVKHHSWASGYTVLQNFIKKITPRMIDMSVNDGIRTKENGYKLWELARCGIFRRVLQRSSENGYTMYTNWNAQHILEVNTYSNNYSSLYIRFKEKKCS